jgi:hypothetical protein
MREFHARCVNFTRPGLPQLNHFFVFAANSDQTNVGIVAAKEFSESMLTASVV